MKHIMRYLLVALIALPFASCEHKDLCYHHPHTVKIKVNFDWQYAPEANPEGMCLFFYPEGGGECRRFDLSNTGGEIEINVGKYHVITYNNDTDGVEFIGTSGFDSHTLCTREGGIFESVFGRTEYSKAPRAEGTEDERVVITPDMMWGCTAQYVEISDAGTEFEHEVIDSSMKGPQLVIDSEDEYEFTFYPEELMCLYSYEVRNVKNLKYYTRLCAALSSMSGTLKPATRELGTEYVTLPLESNEKDGNMIVGEFFTFGHHPELDRNHNFHMYLWDTNGDGYCRIIDVTDQVHNAPNPRRVHIVIDGENMNLPEPITNGGGFNAEVDDWDVINSDIYMGTNN